MALEPFRLLGECVEDRFARPVGVRFVWKLHELHLAPMALERRIHALALERERAGVVVVVAVQQEHSFVRSWRAARLPCIGVSASRRALHAHARC